MLIFAMLIIMNPNQPGSPNQYDFILGPQQPKSSSGFGGSMRNRILVVVVIAVILVIAGSVIANLISGANSGPVDQLKAVAARQVEINRIAAIGQQNAKTSEGRALSATVLYSVITEQLKLQPLIEAAGVKMKPEELNSKKNANTDEMLAAASANNRYDEALKEVLTEYLEDYRVLLKAAYDGGAGPNTKIALENSYNSASAILGTE